jgi:hypothetical protein
VGVFYNNPPPPYLLWCNVSSGRSDSEVVTFFNWETETKSVRLVDNLNINPK